MKTKYILTFVTLLAATSLFAQVEMDGISYSTLSNQDSSCIVISSRGRDGHVLIPAFITLNSHEYNVTGIAERAFENSEITYVSIPRTIRVLGKNCFAGCNGLDDSQIELPLDLQVIHEGAFQGVTLHSVTVGPSVLEIGKTAFNKTLKVVIEENGSPLSLGRQCFGNGEELVLKRNIVCEDDCIYNFSSVTIGDNVTELPPYGNRHSFHRLKSISFGKGMGKIPSFAFCRSLEKVIVNSSIPPDAGGFSNETYEKATLCIPIGSLKDYKESEIWMLFNNIIELEDLSLKEDHYIDGIKKPKFDGEDDFAQSFGRWVNSHFVYPESAKGRNLKGRVIIRFIIDVDGSVTNASVVRGIDPTIDIEALRVIRMSPRWEPARNRDKPFPYNVNYPFIFQFQ